MGRSQIGFTVAPGRLPKAKVMTPEPGRDYLHRASLLRHVDSVLERRLTVLRAPAGFGKTTVLADVSRRKRQEGVFVGWLSLDENDTPSVLAGRLACAFEHGGLDLAVLQQLDGRLSSPIAQQMGMLARAVELHEAPCLLVLDELDRLPRPSAELLDRLVTRGPGNLHVAVACRANPRMDLTVHDLGGSVKVVGTEEFRFSDAEIARFFRGEASDRELVLVRERTVGWPAALTMIRSNAREAANFDVDGENLGTHFVEVGLLRSLSTEIRTGLLELAVFDRIDAALVDEVLGSSDARLRVVKRLELDGFFLPGDEAGVLRLHPWVKDHCVSRLAVEDPVRKRTLHTRIARALAWRGRLTPARRHAGAAGDSALLAELIERGRRIPYGRTSDRGAQGRTPSDSA